MLVVRSEQMCTFSLVDDAFQRYQETTRISFIRRSTLISLLDRKTTRSLYLLCVDVGFYYWDDLLEEILSFNED